ncbi:MAG: hypothetical protein HY777_04860 [Betaproteobacteria bacterium]|nr:hypothetical protein [Betaproteobacteria bacterium]
MIVASPALFAAAGELDPSFGSGGVVKTVLATDTQAYASTLLPDGRLLVAGSTWDRQTNLQKLLVARYGATGTLDASFGSGGVTTTQVLPTSNGSFANAMTVQPDGKIILAGATQFDGANFETALARFNTDGSLDASFGVNGVVATRIGNGVTSIQDGGVDETFAALALLPDGRIVAAGYAKIGGNYVLAIARYNTNGGLDISFGSGGIVTTNTGGDPYLTGAVLQPDGKIVVAGGATPSGGVDTALLVRYNSNGSLDSSFGSAGVVYTTGGLNQLWFNALLRQPDGKLVGAGRGYRGGQYVFALARFNSDGSPDTSFGSSGIVTAAPGSHDSIRAVVLQPDGKLVAGGHSQSSSNVYVSAMARYSAEGVPDSSFGSGGLVRTAMGSIDDSIWALNVAQDGKLIAVGMTQVDTDLNNAIVVARHLGDAVASAATVTAIEYFHANFGHYFITTSPEEAAAIDSGKIQGWTKTGQTFKAYSLDTFGASSVCRFFSTSFAPKSSHFYTPAAEECAIVKNNPNWQYEGLVFSLGPISVGTCAAGTVPLYRMYNNGQSGAPNHRYSTSSALVSTMAAQGWVSEGVIACVPN